MDPLAELIETLLFLGNARCCIEGEAALVTAVNNDLKRILHKLSVRDIKLEQHLPASASQVLQKNSPPALLGSSIQPAQQCLQASVQLAGAPNQSSSRIAIVSGVGSSVTDEPKKQQHSNSGARRALSSSAYGQHAVAAKAHKAASKPSRQASSTAAEQQLRDAAAAATSAAAVCYVPIPMPPHTPVQQQQQAQHSTSMPLQWQLPVSFTQLQAQYAALQQHLSSLLPGCNAGLQQQQQQQKLHNQGLTNLAAAGFMAGLQNMYGTRATCSSTMRQHVHVSSTELQELPVLQFTQQAEFVGLASAALAAVQALGRTAFESSLAAALKLLVPALLDQCQQWVQAHPLQQRPQQQQHYSHSRSQLLGEAVCWRNRWLRSILTASPMGEALACSTDLTSCQQLQQRSLQLALWLPQECWQPLQRLQDALDSPGTGSYSGSQEAADLAAARAKSSRKASPWQLLTAARQLQQHQPVGAPGSTVCTTPATGDVAGSRRRTNSMQPVVTLCYKETLELRQHSRTLQKLQHLLLCLHAESQLAPRLVECLLKGCLAVQQPTRDEQQQHGQNARGTQLQAGFTRDRCLALYRLLYSLTAAAQQRGLGGNCHIAEQQLVDDAELLV